MHFHVFGDELILSVLILDRVSRRDNCVAGGTKNGKQCDLIASLSGREQRLTRILSRGKGFLLRLLGEQKSIQQQGHSRNAKQVRQTALACFRGGRKLRHCCLLRLTVSAG